MGGMTSCDGPVCGRDDEGDDRKTKRRNSNGKRRNSKSSNGKSNGTNGDDASPSSGRRGSRQLVYVQAAPSATQRRPSHTGEPLAIDIEDNSGIEGQGNHYHHTNGSSADTLEQVVAGAIDGNAPALTPIPEEKAGTFTPDPNSRPSFRFGRRPSSSLSGSSTTRTQLEEID